ncbi:mycofactocin-coupled SDR family oxidoreductase [Nonomuraea lactucae]|uniref:mycofactocin-coupled SDR family oxidoreductase n=1 Tax=Nonomuraea lactucae TaxID=2249762 RepID=UPI0019647F51|nr:mycofactocin-coupled SDR family oxidoreductase [Nonomuraea lactucae]
MDRMAGKVALITGAARGQGRSHAVRLAQEGADIIAVDICDDIKDVPYPLGTEEELAVTGEMVRELGRGVVTAKVDVRDADALAETVNTAVDTLGRLDVVVANAGIVTPGLFEEQSIAEWDVTLQVNILGVRNTCIASLPHLKAGGGKSVILVSSVVGLEGASRLSSYIASKHAVIGLTKALAIELGRYEIRVNAIAPGAVANAGIPLGGIGAVTGKEATPTVTALPNQMVEPIDTSNAVLYLAGDESRYVTGTALQIDAGMATI